jgi:signal transduction histidine kinase
MKRLTLRVRLTLVYSGLVLLAGILLLGVTYVLVDNQAGQPVRFVSGVQAPSSTDLQSGPAGESLFVRTRGGDVVNARDLPDYVRQSALQTLLTQGGIALLVVTAMAGALAWFIAGRTLQPLQQITETARRIGGATDGAGRGLHERIGLGGPLDEVRRLADTFDTMLERLDRAFEGQRRFVANASHELRTPLAINRALVEVAVTRPGASPDARQLGDALLLVNGRHERLIDGLLTLADSENELAERRPVDLADMAEHLLEAAQPALRDGGLTLRVPLLTAAPAIGDPVLLERLVHNLVENAIRHNRPDGWVCVETGSAGEFVTLTVANTGPVVPAYEIETLFQPFRRLANERVADQRDRGFGLGLSIVRAVARAHGGTVSAAPRDPSDGGGLTVRVTLPGLLIKDEIPAASPTTRRQTRRRVFPG